MQYNVINVIEISQYKGVKFILPQYEKYGLSIIVSLKIWKGVFMDNKKVSAFTLAEVLITLGVIGVVAALTIPQLVKNYKEKVLLQQAKKMYSVISNALVRYANDMGTPGEYWLIFDGSKTHAQIVDGLLKYLTPVEVCDTLAEIKAGKCGGDYTIRTFKRKNDGKGNVKSLSVMKNYGRIVLKDGSFLSIINENTSSGSCFFNWTEHVTDENGNYTGETIARTSSRCGRILFDVNGLKGPNQYQNDVFEIQIYAKRIWATDSMEGTGGLDSAIQKDNLEKGEIFDVNGKF